MTEDIELYNEIESLLAEEADPKFEEELAKSMRRISSSSDNSSSSSSAPTQVTSASSRNKIPKKRKQETEAKEEETNTSRKKEKNNKNNTNKTKRNTGKKKEKNDREEEGKEEVKAWVSLLSVPKRKGLTAEIQGLYRELVKYAIRALVDRQGRKVKVSEEEQQLLQRWEKNDRELNLEERHGGKLGWG